MCKDLSDQLPWACGRRKPMSNGHGVACYVLWIVLVALEAWCEFVLVAVEAWCEFVLVALEA
jgi:hypothetical protein